MSRQITIDGRRIGEGQPTFIMAEVAMNHDGSLGMAHAFIDACADAGADCVKFQTRIAAAESTLDETFRVPLTSQDATRYGYWQRMEFSEAQWTELAAHAVRRNVVFMSTAFSVEAVELLARVGVPAWKVGSAELGFHGMIGAMVAHRRPILLSTGMSTWGEIEATVEGLRAGGAEFGLFQCTSLYPLPLEEVGLAVMRQLAERFDCPSGLSDHSGTPFPGLAAMALGASMLEVHVAFDKRTFGPDVGSSVTIEQLLLMTKARDAFHAMLSHDVDKDRVAENLAATRRLFLRSLSPRHPLPAGHRLAREDLSAKRPGTGIPAHDMEAVVGRRLLRPVAPDRVLRPEDLE